MEKGAFVGVSLDSGLFTRALFRKFLQQIVPRHRSVEFVLCDSLLFYNKAISRIAGQGPILVPVEGEIRIKKRSEDMERLLFSEIERLPSQEHARVSVSRWNKRIDADFAKIHRSLLIAYASIAEFRGSVLSDVEAHFSRHGAESPDRAMQRNLSALYVLEETAMAVRIAEFGIPYEYYPQDHIATLTNLYADKFDAFGLNIRHLVGHDKHRVFRKLEP